MSSLGFWNVKSGRLRLALIFCCAVTAVAFARNTLSMAMVCMINNTAVAQVSNNSRQQHQNSNYENSSCYVLKAVKDEYQGPFPWTNSERGFIFSALFIGGVISILPAGWISDRYNPKLIVSISLLGSSFGCYLIPITAWHGGSTGLFVLRFIMGFFGQTAITTGISSISARWIPPNERSTVLALYSAGNQIATIIGMPLNAALCRSKNFFGGWPAIFYVNGTFCIAATFLWVVFVTNQPETNRFVTEIENQFIQKSLVNQNLGKRKEMMKNVPWLKMLMSPVLLTCLLCSFTNGFLVTVLQTFTPTYFKEVLLVDLRWNGIFSALPFISQWMSKLLFGVIADYAKKSTNISHTLIAKFFNTISIFGSSVFLIGFVYMDCTKLALAVLFLCLTNTMLSGCIPGWCTSLLCIAPAYSGIISSYGKFANQIGAVLAPYVVTGIVTEDTVYEWRTVFFVIASVSSFSGLLFIIFGSADLQEWTRQPVAMKMENVDNACEILPNTKGVDNGVELAEFLPKNLL